MHKSQNLLCVGNQGASHITVGKLYTKRDSSDYGRVNLTDMDNGDIERTGGGNYSECHFKEINELSIDELIVVAKSLVGMSVVDVRGNSQKIESWKITNTTRGSSSLVHEDVRNNGVSVFIEFAGRSVPLRNLNDYRIVYKYPTEDIYLNDQYTAIVSPTHVEVGCQKFPIEVIENVLKASKRLR